MAKSCDYLVINLQKNHQQMAL